MTEPVELDFDASGPMALIESNGKKRWIIWARDKDGVLHRLNIKTGPSQMKVVERSEQFADAPCA
jgi:hypothetical protein